MLDRVANHFNDTECRYKDCTGKRRQCIPKTTVQWTFHFLFSSAVRQQRLVIPLIFIFSEERNEEVEGHLLSDSEKLLGSIRRISGCGQVFRVLKCLLGIHSLIGSFWFYCKLCDPKLMVSLAPGIVTRKGGDAGRGSVEPGSLARRNRARLPATHGAGEAPRSSGRKANTQEICPTGSAVTQAGATELWSMNVPRPTSGRGICELAAIRRKPWRPSWRLSASSPPRRHAPRDRRL